MNSFTLTEQVDPEQVLECLKSPKLNSEHARRLAHYYRLAKTNHGKIPVKYTRKAFKGNLTGRFYPEGKFLYGAQQWRHLRSSLYSATETDIDAVMCQPTIMLNLANNYGLTCTNLEAYVTDRLTYFDDLDITQTDIDNFNRIENSNYGLKDMGKMVFTATMFGSGIANIQKSLHMSRSPVKRNTISDNLIKELKQLCKSLVLQKDFSDYKELLPVKEQNPGKILSYILCDHEVEAVTELMDAFKKQGIEVTMYIYDGFQVRSKDNATIDRILRETPNDFGLKFIRKPFPETLDKVKVDDARSMVEIEQLLASLDKLIGFTDQHCAQLFLDKHVGNDLAKTNGGIVVYNDKRGVWMESEPDWLLMYEDIAITDGEKVKEHYVQNAKGYDCVKKYLKPMAKGLPNTEIISELNNAILGKLFFNDGWVDLRTGETGVVTNSREVGFWKINRDMPDWREYSMEHPDVVELMTKGLNIFEEEQLDVVLWAVARAAAGYVTDKLVYLIPGQRDSGKGVLCALMEQALGIFPNGICTHTTIPMHKDIENGDAKARSWFIASNMHLARIALSNELVGSKKGRVDGNTIKSLASGGDKIKARLNHKDERDEHNNSTCFFFFNPPTYGGLPTFEPADALQKCMLFEMPFIFTEDEKLLASSPIYKPADHNIKSWIKNNNIGNAFVWLLINKFRDRPLTKKDLPQDFKEDNQDKDDIHDCSPMAVFNRNYVLNSDGWVEASKFREVMGMTSNKSTAWLKKNFKVLLTDGKYGTKTTQTVDGKIINAYHGFVERNQAEPEL